VNFGGWRATSDVGTTLILIRCAPGSDVLEPTHSYVMAYASAHFGARMAERLGVAAYELFANAMSYGTLSDVCLELIDTGSGGAVRVSNTTTQARISMLRGHLDKVDKDGAGTMAQEVRRFAGGGPRPMLGLARVKHEVGMQLDVDVTDDRVTILTRNAR
jgi:hypothetical protein